MRGALKGVVMEAIDLSPLLAAIRTAPSFERVLARPREGRMTVGAGDAAKPVASIGMVITSCRMFDRPTVYALARILSSAEAGLNRPASWFNLRIGSVSFRAL